MKILFDRRARRQQLPVLQTRPFTSAISAGPNSAAGALKRRSRTLPRWRSKSAPLHQSSRPRAAAAATISTPVLTRTPMATPTTRSRRRSPSVAAIGWSAVTRRWRLRSAARGSGSLTATLSSQSCAPARATAAEAATRPRGGVASRDRALTPQRRRLTNLFSATTDSMMPALLLAAAVKAATEACLIWTASSTKVTDPSPLSHRTPSATQRVAPATRRHRHRRLRARGRGRIALRPCRRGDDAALHACRSALLRYGFPKHIP
mmetsp:Transcript_24635/g.77228  ORF Transcript_24635/g.77228 Transcript_24635/m.77228 type:complete len:263 (+) Transcript_24635:2286-3074(+)